MSGIDLRYRSYTDPFAFSFSGQRVRPGGERRESFGEVSGSVVIAGQALEVSGMAFLQHRWGPADREVAPVRTARGSFGADMFFNVADYQTTAGAVSLGYLYEGEEFHAVEKSRLITGLSSAARPHGCDLLIATADRRDFRIQGQLLPAGDHLGFAAFDLGRRRGYGAFETHDADAGFASSQSEPFG
jgi:hypothetical protein